MQTEPPRRQLLAWRERVGHIIDVLPSRSDLDKPFRASIDRYQVGELVFTDCRSDLMVLSLFVPGTLAAETVPDPQAGTGSRE